MEMEPGVNSEIAAARHRLQLENERSAQLLDQVERAGQEQLLRHELADIQNEIRVRRRQNDYHERFKARIDQDAEDWCDHNSEYPPRFVPTASKAGHGGDTLALDSFKGAVEGEYEWKIRGMSRLFTGDLQLHNVITHESVPLPSDGTITIGRHQSCDVVLEPLMASHNTQILQHRKHCTIKCSAHGTELIDHGGCSGTYVNDGRPSNGTYINDSRVAPGSRTGLQPGDSIAIVGFGPRFILQKRTAQQHVVFSNDFQVGHGEFDLAYNPKLEAICSCCTSNAVGSLVIRHRQHKGINFKYRFLIRGSNGEFVQWGKAHREFHPSCFVYNKAFGPDVRDIEDRRAPPEGFGVFGLSHEELLQDGKWVQDDTLTVKVQVKVRPDEDVLKSWSSLLTTHN